MIGDDDDDADGDYDDDDYYDNDYDDYDDFDYNYDDDDKDEDNLHRVFPSSVLCGKVAASVPLAFGQHSCDNTVNATVGG